MVRHSFLSIARRAALACDDKRAQNIKLWDVKRCSGVADYFVVATVESTPQLQAALDEVEESIKSDFNLAPSHRDGRRSLHWAAVDFGGLVVHIMHRQAREFYALERLWDNARTLAWETKPRKNPAKKKPRKPRKTPRRSPR